MSPSPFKPSRVLVVAGGWSPSRVGLRGLALLCAGALAACAAGSPEGGASVGRSGLAEAGCPEPTRAVEEAQQRSRRIRSRELALLAERERERQPTRALLLARAALELDPGPEAVQVTYEALHVNHERRVLGHPAPVFAAAFSPDGQRVLTATGEGALHLWSRQGEALVTLKGHEETVTAASFSPDGQRILTGSLDGSARLWTLEGQAVGAPMLHTAPLSALAFSPDGRALLTLALDGLVRLWTPEGQPRGAFAHRGVPPHTAAFSPDGRHILLTPTEGPALLLPAPGPALLDLIDRRLSRGFTDDERRRFHLDEDAALLRPPP